MFQTWQDIRSRTKTKQVHFNKYIKGTGGGPSLGDPNDKFENDVLETINAVSIRGHTNISESSTKFEFDFQDTAVDDSNSKGEHIQETEIINVGTEPLSTKPANIETSKYISVPPTPKLVRTRSTESDASRRKLTRAKPRQNLIFAAEAAENYKISLDKKNSIKATYYEDKLKLLERIAVSQEKSSIARERIAGAMEEVGHHLKNVIDDIY